jgi:exo-beta-1,3-glucanase (GH17 family)
MDRHIKGGTVMDYEKQKRLELLEKIKDSKDYIVIDNVPYIETEETQKERLELKLEQLQTVQKTQEDMIQILLTILLEQGGVL